jgi:ParB/RepB/Spo0J family partition protein
LGRSGVDEAANGVQQVAVERLQPNPHQPRKTFDSVALEELVDSVRRHGILQPIVVRPAGTDYQIVSGERRWRAAKAAGHLAVPVSVRSDITDDQMLELALVENVQRQDLDAMERAQAFQQMMEALNLTQDQVAEKVGLKRSTVANQLRLLELPPQAQDAIRRGLLSMGHARALLGLSDTHKVLSFVERVVREVMASPEWPRIALFISYDEHGGFADHFAPPSACPPDDREPMDSNGQPAGLGRFDRYGFRVPFIVISPYAKRGYVSHQVYDHTSILRFIEARFGMPAMTKRDANANVPMDMFDFTNAPNMQPPTLTPSHVEDADRARCRAAFP